LREFGLDGEVVVFYVIHVTKGGGDRVAQKSTPNSSLSDGMFWLTDNPPGMGLVWRNGDIDGIVSGKTVIGGGCIQRRYHTALASASCSIFAILLVGDGDVEIFANIMFWACCSVREFACSNIVGLSGLIICMASYKIQS